MALGTTNIALSAVRTYLGYVTDWSLFNICTSGLINKWSRYKPIRDAGAGANWPADSDGYYGFNLGGSNPDKWNYLQPRGGSQGGSPDEPGRLGDFRGYEHAVGLDNAYAGPVIYCDYMDRANDTDMQPSTSLYNVNPRTWTWRFKKNTVSNSIRILTTDLGIDGDFWGIKLTSPSSFNYYKTLANLTNNVDITIDLLFTDPGSLSFTNGFGWPADAEIGQWTWQLFISSSQASSWTSDPPSGMIYLPTASGVTVYSNGTLDMLPYIVCGYTSGSYIPIETFPKAGGYLSATGGSLGGTEGEHWDYCDVETNSGVPYTCHRYESDHETAATWYNFIHSNNDHNSSVCGLNANCANAIGGLSTRVYCDDNTGEDRFGSLQFATAGAEYWIDIYQYGATPTYETEYEDCTEVPGFENVADFFAGTTDIALTFKVNGLPSNPHNVWVRLWSATQGYFYDLAVGSVSNNQLKNVHLLTDGGDIVRGRAYNIKITTNDPNA